MLAVYESAASCFKSIHQFVADFYQGALGRAYNSSSDPAWEVTLTQAQAQGQGQLIAAAQANVAAVWKPWVNAEPIPTGPVNANGITAPLTASYSLPSRFDATSLRIDHNLTNRINLFGRFNRAPSTDKTRLFAKVVDNTSNTDTATVGATITISANMVNDFRANWSRGTGGSVQYNDDFLGAVAPPDSVVFPSGFSRQNTQISYVPNDTSGGVRVGLFSGNVQRQLNFVDTLSMTVGTHQLKFGFDWRRLKPTVAFTNNSFSLGSNTYANLQAGTVGRASASASGTSNTIRFDNYSLFAQDTWKTTRRLTLTYGLRWEINPPPSSVTDKPIFAFQGVFDSKPLGLAPAGTPIWQTKLGAFAPRFGVAYQITPKTVVRGGFGLFYDLGVPGGLAGSLVVEFPWNRSGPAATNIPFDYSNAAFQPPPFTLTPTAPQIVIATAIDPNLKLPLTFQWNVAFERQLGANQSVTVSYVGAKGQDLVRRDSINPASPSPFFIVSVNRNADHSRYDSLQIEFQRRLSRGLQALASYNLAKSTDNNSTDSPFFNVVALQLSDINTETNNGYSDFDVRHNFSVGFSYELPAPAWGKVGGALLKGWALDGIVRARTALPINPVATVVVNGVFQSVRLNAVPGQDVWLADPTQPLGKRLNPAAFSRPTNNQPGNIIRNSIRNFPVNQTDLALRRRFNLTERVKLDLRVEYFNLFNHPMFALGLSNLSWGSGATPSAAFGKISQTLNTAFGNTGLSSGFSGFSPLYQMGGPRSGQLTLKLSF